MQMVVVYLVLVACALFIARRLYHLFKCKQTGCTNCAFYRNCKSKQKKHD